MEATARGSLDEVQHIFAIAKRHEDGCDGTHLHAEVTKGSKGQPALVAVFTSNMLAASRVLDAR
jgi:hypothetical protein